MTAKNTTSEPQTAPAPDNSPVSLTMENLQMLAAVITQTVLTGLKESGALGSGMQSNLGEVIGNAVADGMSKSTRRKISIGEYLAKIRAGRPLMNRRYFQNGIEIVDTLSSPTPREIDLLNGLHRTGRYINRLVECIIGLDGVDEVVYLRYHDKGDHKFALSAAGVRNFEVMLQMITDAQAEENAQEEAGELVERKQVRGRTFGQGKRTLAAEAAR